VGIERASRLAVARLVREFDLDIEPSTLDRVAGFQQIPIDA
jgi:hypothetical protein